MQWGRFKFNLLIWVAAAFVVGFGGIALRDVWGYLRLEAHSRAEVYRWKIVEISPSEFGIKASYTFTAQGKSYKNKILFSKPYHFNRESAQKQIKEYASRTWRVWFQPSCPKNSSLERIFPIKKCIYAVMTLGIFFYFLCLDRYRVQNPIN